jgi:hypothetical protein
MTSNSQLIVYSPDVNITEKKSAINNSIQEVITVSDLKGYKVYTALLTQSGGDDNRDSAQGDNITLGVTYYISINSENADLTIFGAPNSNVGTSFVCTNAGTLPLIGSISLLWNEGAPVVTVLENTIGNIWFNYEAEGSYGCQSNNLFTTGKTFILVTPTSDSNAVSITVTNQTESVKYISPLNNSLNAFDNGLLNTPIEIRVYN